jgi:predicted ATP-grasp superfamily ATP-dependent carboligase
MARVLVTDGEQRAALAAVRSLAPAGHEVYVCSTRGRSLAGASRHARAEARMPDPLTDPAAYREKLRRLVKGWDIQLLLPIAEPAILAILPIAPDMPGLTIPFPDLERFRSICDKPRVLDAARELGIGVPEQLTLQSPEGIAALEWEALSYPMVVKPARSVVGNGASRQKTSVAHVTSAPALRAVLAGLSPDAFPVLLQQRVTGPGIGVFVLLWEGRLLASFFHRRIREKPPSGGVSVYRESTPPRPQLLDHSLRLLERFSWQGVAMVEYKLDESTGVPYLMEVNGRLWGSLQLAIDAGVDFPALLVEAATGGDPRPVTTYRTDVRSRWWWGDVDHLLLRLRRSPAALALPAGEPGRLRTGLDFLRSPGRNEVLRLSDPLPALRESLDWIRGR